MSKNWKKEFDDNFLEYDGHWQMNDGKGFAKLVHKKDIKNFIHKVEQQAYKRCYKKASNEKLDAERGDVMRQVKQDTLKQVKDLIESKLNGLCKHKGYTSRDRERDEIVCAECDEYETDYKREVYDNLLKDIDNL